MDGIADHFHELVPDMALEFPFELDDFQKEVNILFRAFIYMQSQEIGID